MPPLIEDASIYILAAWSVSLGSLLLLAITLWRRWSWLESRMASIEQSSMTKPR